MEGRNWVAVVGGLVLGDFGVDDGLFLLLEFGEFLLEGGDLLVEVLGRGSLVGGGEGEKFGFELLVLVNEVKELLADL